MTTVTSQNAPRRFTAFRCPAPVLGALKDRAQADGRTLSNLIVYILAREVTRKTKRHG
jgi:hypothetical protein